jgi:anti-sigma-K factor RskA
VTAHDLLLQDAAAYALGSLDADSCRAFEAHLAGCETCAAEVRSLRGVTAALGASVPPRTPRPELRARVLGSIAGTVAPPAPRSSSRHSAWLPLAASLLMAVGAAAYAVRLQSRVGELEERLQQARLQASATDRLLADARRTAGDSQAAMAVIAAPDVARIDLAGQAIAPQARARALWSRDRGMVFTVANLPPLPAGRVYQVWVVTADAPISAGLLMPDATGSGSVYFDTPADIPPPVALAVTLEPAGGVPVPTGERYLIGTPRAL